MPLFCPTARQLNVLMAIGFLALGYALYVRYLAIELPWVGLSCHNGLATWLCFSRGIVVVLFKHWVFGAAALAAAILHLVRPSMILFGLGIAASALGVVLYNSGGAGIAIGLLILSLARPAREAT
jgi:hypothetical protein